ncbi:tetratricopeptide repeat protein [Actinoplanes siamensis]|uniref:tetratricopeptide repeat protein n=1 Tax=Actinoplanes siamensis TaxID=1223317 RepID=UPI001942EF42|nr:tetratricopeptide repeat protein [Actinoplanes siamensis]
MRAGRVVGVEAPGLRGSGFLIAGRLVLTSARAVPEAGAAVTVYPAVSGRAFDGVVAWRGTPGGPDDAALVRVDDPGWAGAGGPDPALGRVATSRPGLPGAAWGFHRPQWAAEAWQVAGSVDPGAGDRFVLRVSGGPAETGPLPAGAVGAAVFCHGLLTGVVTGGHAGALETVPVSALCREPDFLAAAGRDQLRLWPVELAGAQRGDPGRPRSPSALLRAGAQVVGFRGRHRLMDELGAWCSGNGFAAMLLHGPAGQGKSRVGHELVRRLTAVGWATLWLREDVGGETLGPIGDVVVPLLIVVDDAESRPGQVRALLEACGRHDGRQPLRVLLLARDTTLRSEPLLGGAPVVALDDDEPDRRDAYRRAVHDLGAALPRIPGYATHDWPGTAARLAGTARDAGGQALTVQTEALADLLDAMWPGPAADGRKTPPDRVLAHEQRHWAFTAAWQGLDLPESELHDLLAVMILFGAADRDQAARLLSAVLAEPGPVLDWLAELYPGPDGRFWDGPRPDRLAERFAGRRLAASPTLPEPFLPVADRSQLRRLLVVCARAGQPAALTDLCVRHAEHLTDAALDAVTRVAEPEPLIAALRLIAAGPDVPPERLARIGERLPRSSPAAAEVAQRIAERHRRTGRLPELATALYNLSVRLGDLGRHGPALAAIEEAVLLHRRLAAQEATTYEAGLARSLSGLAVRLGELDQPEPALAAVAEATEIYRRLAGRQPETFLPELALALRNLALGLGALERHPQALTAIEQSVTLYRQLAAAWPDESGPELATSLSVLGITLGLLDRDEQSRAVAEEAVAIRRGLTARRPDMFWPGLATALTDLAVRHVVLGERAQAQAAIDEALTIRHGLMERQPDAYAADLEWSLHVHKVIQEM